jgi:glycosyltransferase involved in cell wall biosynthesis
VIDAFGHLWEARDRLKLIIAAKRSSDHSDQELERYIASKPWRDSISVFYNSRSVPDLLASADIFVFATPSDSNDSLPRALLEAQAAGVPAVTCQTSGCPEIVADCRTGFVVPYEARAIAEKVLTLAGDPELRGEMSVESRRYSRERFSWDEMADRYAAIFHQALGTAPVVPAGELQGHDVGARASR